jgi:hypothetical protein
VARVVHARLDADHRIEFQQRGGRRRIAEVRAGEDARRQCIGIDLEADREGGDRIDLLHDLVHAQAIGPQLLVAEGVVAEDLPAPGDHRRRKLPGRRTGGGARFAFR